MIRGNTSKSFLAIGHIALALVLILGITGCSSPTPETSHVDTSAETGTEASQNKNASPQEPQATPGESPESVPLDAYADAEQVQALVNAGAHVMDVRNRYDFAEGGHIPDARNLATGKALEINVGHYDKEDTFIVVADKEEKGEDAWMTIVGTGVDPEKVKILEGGMDAWIAAGFLKETSEVEGC